MDIYILEDITEPLAKDIVLDVANANGNPITAHIMSMGGSVLAGNAIAASLKNSPSYVTTNVIGVAASMAAVISQAGDKRTISPDATFNIHNASMSIGGRNTKEAHKEAIETLEKLDNSMTKAFARTGLSSEDIQVLMQSDKLLSADEAMTLGFFDSYSQPVQAVAKLNHEIKNMSKLSELMGKVETAAIKLGVKSTDDDAKKALVAALETELKGQVEEQMIEVAETAETGADILSSEMVSREEYEMFKAEMLALIQPLLGAVETLPTPEQTTEVVEEVTTAKLDNLLRSIKSKTTMPAGKQSFEQPAEKAKEDWSVYDARKEAIKEKNNR